jgi:N-acyl homoserine lactone hydrolase
VLTESEALMPTINAHLAAELTVEGEKWPVFVWTIDHPAGRVLVDTGMIDVRPEVDDMSPTPHPENIPRDIACVINTHLHFDHCGGNRLFPGVPIHVLPGIRLLPAPGHTHGHQVVVVETDAGTNVLGGDVGTSFDELGSGTTDGQRRVLALAATTWLTHAEGAPKVPRPNSATTRAGARPATSL